MIQEASPYDMAYSLFVVNVYNQRWCVYVWMVLAYFLFHS